MSITNGRGVLQALFPKPSCIQNTRQSLRSALISSYRTAQSLGERAEGCRARPVNVRVGDAAFLLARAYTHLARFLSAGRNRVRDPGRTDVRRRIDPRPGLYRKEPGRHESL